MKPLKVKRYLSIILTISILMTAINGYFLPVVKAMENNTRSEDEYIYYTDLFYAYPSYLFNDGYLLTYNTDIDNIFTNVFDEYVSSPAVVGTGIEKAMELFSSPSDIFNFATDVLGMEFTYSDGIWDDEKHKWIDNGWKPSTTDSNLITVKNSGSSDVKMELTYNPVSPYNGLSGTFIDSLDDVVESKISLDANGVEQKYWFNISGTTDTRWIDYVSVGTITLTISE